jgi:hypothetical protein
MQKMPSILANLDFGLTGRVIEIGSLERIETFLRGIHNRERKKINSDCAHSKENLALAKCCPDSRLLQRHLCVSIPQELLATNCPLSRDCTEARRQ